jgi:hypothetical protein
MCAFCDARISRYCHQFCGVSQEGGKSWTCSAFEILSSRSTAISRRAGVPIKELQPQASNRAIAKAVKLDEKTIRNEKKGADTSATGVGKSESFQQQGADQSAPAPSSPPPAISGDAAANLVHRREVGAAERVHHHHSFTALISRPKCASH